MTLHELHVDMLEKAGGEVAIRLETRELGRGVGALRVGASAIEATRAPGAAGPRVSGVAPLPDGPILRLDDIPEDRASRRRIATALVDAATDAGFRAEALVLAAVQGIPDLDRCRKAVVLRIFPAPAGAHGRISSRWLDTAADWVFGDQLPDATVRMRVLGVEVEVAAKDAPGILLGCSRARAWCDVVSGDTASRVRTASLSFGIAPHVAIGGGGPACDDDGLVARFELLCEVARDAVDSTYACVNLEHSFADLGAGLSAAARYDDALSPNRIAGTLLDRAVPGVFPAQVLGPGHVARLGPAPPGSEALENRRLLVTIGDVTDWLQDSDAGDAVRNEALTVLEPLRASRTELDAAMRDAAAPSNGARPPAESTSLAVGLPSPAEIIIDGSSHPRRGTRLTVLELAAWIAGEHHTDSPACVSPVVATYVRELTAGLDHERRQGLKRSARSLIGTSAGSDDVERARAWILADRLMRTHAPTWLRAAGLDAAADRLGKLAGISSDTDLVRGVDVLAEAIGAASDLLAHVGDETDDVDTVEAIAWETWEEVAQRSGWSAAASAVAVGLPSELTFATDQRAMECSRDPEQRALLAASTRGLGDEVWTTALREVAASAWDDAWAAAEHLVRHESTFSVKTTLRRSMQSELDDADGVAIEILNEEVDHAARDTIARLILVADDTSDYWARGVEAATKVDGGDAWLRALDGTRSVLGAQLFDDAIEAAQSALASWAARAPEIVARAVVAAVTREACSVAGRGVAARVAADVLLRGGTGVQAGSAAAAALENPVATLADDAVAVLAELVDPPG